MRFDSLFVFVDARAESSCKANAIVFARIAEPQPIMSKKSTRNVGEFSAY